MACAKPVFDITPFTMLDFPDHLACIVWFAGCNMRCSYCYNPHIVLGKGNIGVDELLDFLRKKVGRLEGVVLSGGECTLYPKLTELCYKIKELGFKIKIDTNGSSPQVLDSLLKKSLIDFVSLDFKAAKSLFKNITHSNFYDSFIHSLQILCLNSVPFEVRTTVHADLLNEKAINEMADILLENGYKGIYYLQNYLHDENSLGNLNANPKKLDKTLLTDKIRIKFRN
ncbi:MAG: anaerobic ribonucleoside-triphosphate reductase activating protein [Campylobacteraceae bacterium]|jgi:pyruvate formate lyase activating enzyme|nr:anaerobic ribonucleoside-triphosphate reductase activating protein [Campylobacteraceae bacterium]